METICFVLIYAVLSQNQFVLPFTLFCREINFVAIYAFLRGEKFRQKLCLWRKKDKYQVCTIRRMKIIRRVKIIMRMYTIRGMKII